MSNNLTFRECFGLLMERSVALQFHYQILKSKKSDFDVSKYTFDEIVILFELSSQDGLFQNEIAKKIHKNKSTVKRTIDKLEKKQAVSKVKNIDDSRKYNVYLTKHGLEFKRSLERIHSEEVAWIKQSIGEGQYESMMEILNNLYDKTLERYCKEHN